GRGLCQKILDVLTSDQAYPYLGPDAAEALRQQREEIGTVVEPVIGGVEVVADEIRWWTFAGGRINSTLRYALLALGSDWKVTPDNYAIKLRGDGLSRARFSQIIDQLRDIELWENEQLWCEVAESLPTYRLSKFQPLMPPWVEREVVASYLLDVAGAWHWLSNGAAAPFHRGPTAVGTPTPADHQRLATLEQTRSAGERPLERDPSRPIEWVRTPDELHTMCTHLAEADLL